MMTNRVFRAQMPAVAKRSAPLKGKLVFLDTKAPVSKLREQLELLGARVETFFSKDIWCVITDKQVDEANKKLLSLAANSARQRTPFLNRTQVLLQAAQQKEVKKAEEVQTVVQECKQWDIPMLSIRTASNSVSKLMKKYQPVGELSSLKKSSASSLRKVVSESHLGKSTRLEGHEVLKVEDRRQQYKPLYKTFKEQNYPRVSVTQPKSGAGTLIGPFADDRDCLIQKGTVEESRRNRVETAKETTVADSKPKSRKRTIDSKHADSKSKYCELCHEYFQSLKTHLSSAGHLRTSADSAGDLKKIVKEFQLDFFESLEKQTESGSPKPAAPS